jgi:hypothetical protein
MEPALETRWDGDRQGRYRGEGRQECVCPLCGSVLAARSIGFEAGLVFANGGLVQLMKGEGAVFGRLFKIVLRVCAEREPLSRGCVGEVYRSGLAV